MKILPISNSNNAIPNWFYQGLFEFENSINEKIKEYNGLIEGNKIQFEPDNKQCNDNCRIEVFYFFDKNLKHIPAYKNGIWIKIHNNYGINIWLRVGFHEDKKKKIAVFSEYDLDFKELEHASAFGLPPNFDNGGIWMNNKGKRVSHITFAKIIEEVFKYSACLYNAKRRNN